MIDEKYVSVIPAEKGWYICDPVFDDNVVVGLYETEIIAWSVVTMTRTGKNMIETESFPVVAGSIFTEDPCRDYCLRNPEFIYSHPFDGGFECTREDVIGILNRETERDQKMEQAYKKRKGDNHEK